MIKGGERNDVSDADKLHTRRFSEKTSSTVMRAVQSGKQCTRFVETDAPLNYSATLLAYAQLVNWLPSVNI